MLRQGDQDQGQQQQQIYRLSQGWVGYAIEDVQRYWVQVKVSKGGKRISPRPKGGKCAPFWGNPYPYAFALFAML